MFLSFFNALLINKILLRCGEIHKNLGPNDKSKLSLCHWNLNSISVNNFEELLLFQAFNSVYKYGVICISETFLNSSYSNDDPSLCLKGYNMIRSDHPDNLKRGGVCIYFKEGLL